MTTRILPREEYARLAGTELEAVASMLPESARVIVIEDADGAIVGCWSLFTCVHVEGVWIAPSHRNRGTVARRLLVAMTQHAREIGAHAVMTGAMTDDVRAFIARLGGSKLPGDQYVMPLEKPLCQPQ